MSSPVAKVACRYSVGGEVQGVWTFHVQKTPSADPFDGGDCTELAERVYTWWSEEDPPVGTTWAPLQNRFFDQFVLEAIEVYSIEPNNGFGAVMVVGEAGQSVGGEVINPGGLTDPQLAHVIGLRTSLNTRRGRGRIYLPARIPTLGDDEYTEHLGTVGEGRRAELAEIGACLARRILDPSPVLDPWALAVWSRVDQDSRAVIQFAIPDRVACQRRRRVDDVGIFVYGLDAQS